MEEVNQGKNIIFKFLHENDYHIHEVKLSEEEYNELNNIYQKKL